MKKIDILKEIVAKKKEKILLAKQNLPEDELKLKIQGMAPVLPFMEAITKPRQICLVAEIKRASPSKGIIRENFNLQEIAKAYQEAGVQAISVLTEEDYFQGNISYINEVKAIANLPVLRKDFMIDPYQIYETRTLGADCILLIVAALADGQMHELSDTATCAP